MTNDDTHPVPDASIDREMAEEANSRDNAPDALLAEIDEFDLRAERDRELQAEAAWDRIAEVSERNAVVGFEEQA